MRERLDVLERLVTRHLRFKSRKSYRYIAEKLGVKPSTVRHYLKPIERKKSEAKE